MKRSTTTLLALGAAVMGVGVFLACDRGSLARAKKHLESAGLHVESEEDEDEAANLTASHLWWTSQRAFPNGIPEHAQRHGSDGWDGITRLPAFVPHPGHHADPPPPPTWQLVGPTVVVPSKVLPSITFSAGRVNALAADPSAAGTIYAGTSYGGIWKTMDAGVTWKSVSDAMPTLSVGALAIDSANPQTVYAGTGEGGFGYAGVGIFKSTDGGGTWQVVGAKEMGGYAVTRIVVDQPSGWVYASTQQGAIGTGDFCGNLNGTVQLAGLFRSKDGGTTWEMVLKDAGVSDFTIDPLSSPRKILASEDGYHAVLYDEATSMGTTVDALPRAPSKTPATYSFARAPSDPTIIWASASQNNGQDASVFRSSDNGVTWTSIPTPTYCTPQCYYDNVISVSPADPNVVWFGGGRCSAWVSNDAMTAAPTWTPISVPGKNCDGSIWVTAATHPDAHSLIWIGTDLYFGTDGGVTRTKDGGKTWEQLSKGMATLQYYNICILESDTNYYMASAQDNGMQIAQPDGTWRVGTSGDGAGCALNTANQGAVMLAGGVVYRWNGQNTGFPTFDASSNCQKGGPGCGDRAQFIPPMTSDPMVGTTIYIGTQKLYRSTNAGGTWTAISPDLTYGTQGESCMGGKTSDTLTAIGVSRTAPTTLYTGSAGGKVQASFDGGTTWTSASAGLPHRFVTGIAVDPKNDKTVLASFSGFSSVTPVKGHVFRSTDGGVTWALRDIPMDSPVDTITAHPTRSDVLFAGTDYGVLATVDGGQTWTPIADGLPRVPSLSIKYRQADDTLVLGTFGRGVWKLPLAGTLGVAPTMLSLTAQAGTMSAPATVAVSSSSVYGSEIPFTAATAVPWLTATPAAPAAATAVNVTIVADATALVAGEYDGKVTVTPASSTPLEVAVHLSVTGQSSAGAGGSAGSGGSDTTGAGGMGASGGTSTGTGGSKNAGGAAGTGTGGQIAFGAGGQLAFGAGGQLAFGGAAAKPSNGDNSDSSGSCGCEITPSRSWTTPALAAFALLVASRRRRRQR